MGRLQALCRHVLLGGEVRGESRYTKWYDELTTVSPEAQDSMRTIRRNQQ